MLYIPQRVITEYQPQPYFLHSYFCTCSSQANAQAPIATKGWFLLFCFLLI
jgi:hypothetical protein